MIVNYINGTWEIIAQRNHALLAAQICANWKTAKQLPRWTEILVAVAEHDDVFNELESGPLVNGNGGPVNFKDNVFNPKASRKLLDMAASKGSFIALLTGRHVDFTHGKEPSAKTFIQKLRKDQAALLKISGATNTEVDRAYELLEFCDAFSLLLCQGEIQPERRSVEISSGPDRTAYSLHAEHDRLVVCPWPFEAHSFEVTLEVRTLSQLIFSSNQQFRKLFKKARPELRTYKISQK
jgi:hypothetical protein